MSIIIKLFKFAAMTYLALLAFVVFLVLLVNILYYTL